MRGSIVVPLSVLLACLAAAALAQSPANPDGTRLLTGKAALGDWHDDAPLVRRKITIDDLPKPYATRSASNGPRIARAQGPESLKVPPGFRIALFASDLQNPRTLVTAPNGDIFVAETAPGRIRVLRAADGQSRPQQNQVFASGLDAPFGIAFYPPGPDPQWVYVTSTVSVFRYPYRIGDLEARGRAEVVVPDLAGGGGSVRGGHVTRDIVFSPDGRQMFVSVGSVSNDGEGIGKRDARTTGRWEAEHGVGAAWDYETDRATVLAFDPEGHDRRIFASGIRNCFGMAIEPGRGELWCSTNERDGLGDDLVPDFVTRVRSRAFYGWPWYYLGPNEDPRHRGERPDLKSKIMVPDVLIQAHSAVMHMVFYDAGQFPQAYRGDAFVALHGSWNRAKRTGHKIIRVRMKDGIPTGEYEDFLTGFVVSDTSAWGRPVGVTVTHDGSLLVSEDGNGTLWLVSYRGE